MANPAEGGAAAVVPAGDREAVQNFFLDAARVLMLFSAVATIGTTSAELMLAFLSLLLWLLGVCLLAMVPAAGRFSFPHAALVATAMAVAVLKHLFTLWS